MSFELVRGIWETLWHWESSGDLVSPLKLGKVIRESFKMSRVLSDSPSFCLQELGRTWF